MVIITVASSVSLSYTATSIGNPGQKSEACSVQAVCVYLMVLLVNMAVSIIDFATSTTVGSSTYALVTSGSSASSATLAGQSGKSKVLTYDDGIQIIDITNPSSPTPVLAISDDQDGYTELNGAASITTTTIGSSTYALVASRDDSGVQIIDITDPTDPIAVSAATDNQNNFTRLAGAYSIATTTIDSSHYAIVVAPAGTDRGVQIINITNPNTPVAVSTFTSDNLIDAKSVTTTTLGSSTYAL